ncbi:Rab GTPase-binding exocyst subunit S15, partial [Cryomyces antarcticus]
MSTTPTQEASPYMVELTRYLSNIMSSVLLGLPTAVKSLIYFDALDHAARSILALPLSPHITRISPAAVAALTRDVEYLTDFVNSLSNAAVLQENLDEIRQTVELMGAENAEEFFEAGRGGRRFGKVDKMSGAVLLEKVAQGAPPPAPVPPPATLAKPAGQFSTLSSRLGINK